MSNRSRYLSAAAATFLLAWQPSAPTRPSARLKQTVLESPLRFEANRGQTDASVKFIARGPGYTRLLAEREAVLNLRGGAVRMRLLAARATAVAKGLDRLSGATNYLIGNDLSKWRTDIPAFARVQFEQVYPGIDLVYYGSQRKLEYDFVVAPGADPARIRLAFEGARKLSVDSSGDLVIDGPAGETHQHAPVVYQQINGVRKSVEGRYVIEHGRRVAFRLAAYDKKQKLVIDPKLSYSTYYGGTGDDGIFDIAVDSSGYAYITGVTGSSDLPTTTGAFNTNFGPSQVTNVPTAAFGDAFVTKIAQDGKTLGYATYLGGNNADGAESIAVDSSGRVVLFGATASTNFPTKNAYRSSLAGWSELPTDIFITVLNAAGNALIYSTYFGDTAGQVFIDGTFEGGSVTFDSAGNVIIVG